MTTKDLANKYLTGHPTEKEVLMGWLTARC